MPRFWSCPNGKECKYRHKLPPGFQLKSEIKELLAAQEANKPSIEEEIEAERQLVDAKTPITEQVRAHGHMKGGCMAGAQGGLGPLHVKSFSSSTNYYLLKLGSLHFHCLLAERGTFTCIICCTPDNPKV